MTWYQWLSLAGTMVIGLDNPDQFKDDYAQLSGVWSFALVEVDGVKQPEIPFATNKMILSKDGKYAIVQGRQVTRGTLSLDPTKNPKHYDPTITKGKLKGLTFPGIYQLAGDSLTICLPLRDKERPGVFASKPGSGLMLQVFKREKQSVQDGFAEAERMELSGK
jgi:uncharacterized protein (TIGR03067 family)